MPFNKTPAIELKKEILVLRFSALGDVVLSMPAIDFLCDSGLFVHVLTKEAFAPIFKALAQKNLIVHTISDKAPLSELIAKAKSLRNFKYLWILDLHQNLRSKIFCIVYRLVETSIQKSRIFVLQKPRFHEWILFAVRRDLYLKLFSRMQPRWEQSLCKAIQSAQKMGLPLLRGPEDLSSVVELSRTKKYLRQLPISFKNSESLVGSRLVAICVESAWKEKQWSEKRFLELAQKLSLDGFAVVWVGLRSAKHLTEQTKGSFDFTETFSILETAAILSKVKLLVCNDAGLMHVAEAVGTPVLGVFGPTSGEIGFAPRLKDSKIVEENLWCRPCSKNGRMCFRITQKRLCLDLVSVDSVYQVVKSTFAVESPERMKNQKQMIEKSST